MGNLRSVVDFPEAGEGVSLRFRTSDLYAMQRLFGDKWFADANTRMDRFDLEFIEACLKNGAKKDDKPFKLTLDGATENCALDVVALKCLDGLYLAVFGDTFPEHMGKLADQLAKIDQMDRDRPQTRPAISSTTSDAPLSGRDSDPTNSGDSVL